MKQYGHVIVAATGPSLFHLAHGVNLRDYGYVIGVNTYWQYGDANVHVMDDPLFEKIRLFKAAVKCGHFFYNRESDEFGKKYNHTFTPVPVEGGDELLAWWHSGITPALNLAINFCLDGGTIGIIGADYIVIETADPRNRNSAKNYFEQFAGNCLELCARRHIHLYNYSDCSRVTSIPFAMAPWVKSQIPRSTARACVLGFGACAKPDVNDSEMIS